MYDVIICQTPPSPLVIISHLLTKPPPPSKVMTSLMDSALIDEGILITKKNKTTVSKLGYRGLWAFYVKSKVRALIYSSPKLLKFIFPIVAITRLGTARVPSSLELVVT